MQGVQSHVQMQQQGKKEQMENIDVDALRKKTMIVKIIVACLALGCVILVIVVLSKSSIYFGQMFKLDTETTIKAYLRKNYGSMMALLYLSIFGFVIAIADSILLFFKFTQKDKLLWFHLAYYLAFLICGCVALTNKDYKSYMTGLNGKLITDPACLAGAFLLECALVPSYLSYNSTVTTFFIIFNVFFVAFAALYHYAAAILMPFETEVSKREPIKTTVFNPGMNNETFVSQINDEYA